jgi:hypothetical protein
MRLGRIVIGDDGLIFEIGMVVRAYCLKYYMEMGEGSEEVILWPTVRTSY